MDELIGSGAASPIPNRETTDGRDASSSPVPEGTVPEGTVPEGPVPIGSLIFADELPDGVVVADEAGRIIVFNRCAARLTGLDPAEVIGKFVFDVLPLRDDEGRDWWVYADPYHGLATRTRHPERSLYLSDETEVLVSVGVRGPRAREVGRAAPGVWGMGPPRSGGVWGRPPRTTPSGGWSSACAARSSGSGWNAAAPSSCRPSRTSCARR